MSILERIDNIINESATNVETKKDQTGHSHGGKVNENGDGSTTTTIRSPKHVHKIFQWLIQPNNGHTHNLED